MLATMKAQLELLRSTADVTERQRILVHIVEAVVAWIEEQERKARR